MSISAKKGMKIYDFKKATFFFKYEIVGTFHSHPIGTAYPGYSDLSHAVDNSLMLIFDVTKNHAQLWHIKRRQPNRINSVIIR